MGVKASETAVKGRIAPPPVPLLQPPTVSEAAICPENAPAKCPIRSPPLALADTAMGLVGEGRSAWEQVEPTIWALGLESEEPERAGAV